MNIVFLTSCLGSGGAERVSSTLCNAWARRGDKVTLIPTFSGPVTPFYRLDERVKLLPVSVQMGAGGNALTRYSRKLGLLRRLIRERQPDVVISFLANVNLSAILACAGSSIPLIISERSNPAVYPDSRFWRLARRLSYRHAAALVVQTEAIARISAKLFPGLQQVRVIANPLPEGFAPAGPAASGPRKVLLSMGRLSEEKQVHQLISAFHVLADRHPAWDLHIHGEGPLEGALRAQVCLLRLEQRVFFKGRTSRAAQTMQQAHAFALTSRFEGFPNALLEAMACGLPCVATDCISGPRELSRDGQDALLVPLREQAGLVAALDRVMGDEQLRQRLGEQASRSVRARFSMECVLQRWDQLFFSLSLRPANAMQRTDPQHASTVSSAARELP